MGINTKVLSGFMELLPEEQLEFDRLKALVASSFAGFGYTPIETPAIERSEILSAKGGQETDRQTYFVTNGLTAAEPGQLAMRFDLTVPLARYVAGHAGELSFPFKVSHIGKSYRGERAQKGRFREFYQCDIDVIGKDSLSILYDAEIPFCIYKLFRAMEIGKFTIRISNRRLLSGFLEARGMLGSSQAVLRLIDKSEKISEGALASSLHGLGLDSGQIDALLRFIAIKGEPGRALGELSAIGTDSELYRTGLRELESVAGALEQMGMESGFAAIDPSIARGLDYYTGTVYETGLDDTPVGSICSGGRYDDLAGQFTSQKLPGVGVSIGLTRLFWQLRDAGLLQFQRKTVADCVLIPESPQCMGLAFEAAGRLRDAGLSVDIFYEDVPMKKKFQYVSKKDAPYTAVAREGDFGLQYREGAEIAKVTVTLEELVGRLSCRH